MLESVAMIGKMLTSKENPLDSMIMPVFTPHKTDKIYLIVLDFESKQKKMQTSIREIDQNVRVQCRWIGNIVGNRPQFYLTTDKLEYLAGQSLSNLIDFMEKRGRRNTDLYRNAAVLIKQYFVQLPNQHSVLDLESIGMADKCFLDKAWASTSKEKQSEIAKEVVSTVAGELKRHVLKKFEIKAAQAALWTFALDGTLLVQNEGYAETVFDSKGSAMNPGSQKSVKSIEGVCSVCGVVDTPVTYDFSQLDFLKYYINDKIGFASGVSEAGFFKNFLICAQCRRALVIAERHVRNNMNLRIGPLNFLVLPYFAVDTKTSDDDLEAWTDSLKMRIDMLTSLTGWIEKLGGQNGLEREIKYSLPYDTIALMDFIFYQKNQSEFRINHVIKDVVPGRVTELLRQSFQYAAKAETLFGRDQAWRLDLTEIYKLIPLNQGKRAAEHKKLLYVYEALFSRRRIRYDFLILQFVLLAEIYHTKSFEGTSIKAQAGFEEISLVDSMLRANLFLIFLKNEKLLEGEMSLNGMTEFEGIDNEMQVYLMEMKYGEPAAALFLLGYLMNQIGKEQSETGYKQKPVLEKINFSGMFWGKVAQLTNTVFNQLKHYDVLRYNERTFAAMKLLMDKHRDSWGLSPQENVFFILSGYAYATRTAIKGAKKKVNNYQMEETNNE